MEKHLLLRQPGKTRRDLGSNAEKLSSIPRKHLAGSPAEKKKEKRNPRNNSKKFRNEHRKYLCRISGVNTGEPPDEILRETTGEIPKKKSPGKNNLNSQINRGKSCGKKLKKELRLKFKEESRKKC